MLSDERLKDAFNLFDRDGSGQVEFNELSKILGTDVSVQELGDLFKEVDLDGNGTMDFEEFKTMMMKMSDN
jgi:Ca2+-binding EF-hand superfamily protein